MPNITNTRYTEVVVEVYEVAEIVRSFYLIPPDADYVYTSPMMGPRSGPSFAFTLKKVNGVFNDVTRYGISFEEVKAALADKYNMSGARLTADKYRFYLNLEEKQELPKESVTKPKSLWDKFVHAITN